MDVSECEADNRNNSNRHQSRHRAHQSTLTHIHVRRTVIFRKFFFYFSFLTSFKWKYVISFLLLLWFYFFFSRINCVYMFFTLRSPLPEFCVHIFVTLWWCERLFEESTPELIFLSVRFFSFLFAALCTANDEIFLHLCVVFCWYAKFINAKWVMCKLWSDCMVTNLLNSKSIWFVELVIGLVESINAFIVSCYCLYRRNESCNISISLQAPTRECPN